MTVNDSCKKYNQAVLFYSNSLEILFKNLKQNLFSETRSPFAERMVVVPSPEMRRWIQFQFAQNLNIAAGITHLFLDEVCDLLLTRLLQKREFYFPNQLELTIRLAEEIAFFLDEKNRLFSTLESYLRGKDRRMIALASWLASLFYYYGIYGKKNPKKWEQNPKNWQEILWKKIYQNGGWNYPLQLVPYLGELATPDLSESSIHLFAIGHLSPFHHYFFQKVAEKIPFFIYHLSPCQEFWSDLPTKWEEDPSFIDNYHPLLISLGKVSAKMAALVEESDAFECEEHYAIPVQETQLNRLQKDLLLLRSPKEPRDDDSIQIHRCATPHREIQVLHNALLALMQAKGIKPNEIVVMAPDITLYEPYIRSYFESYQISGLRINKNNQEKEGLFLLLNLDKERWRASALLRLFEYPLFQRKMGWEKKDLLQIKEWIKNSGIRWGVDREQRDFLLQRKTISACEREESGTWMSGIDSLLLGLAASERTRSIEFSQAELLGEIATVLESLKNDLAHLHAEKTIPEWIHFLVQLQEKYFSFCEKRKGAVFERFRTIQSSKPVPFSTLEWLLKEQGNERGIVHGNEIQSVRFGTFTTHRALPARIVCLIGMNQNAFPRSDVSFSLNLLHKDKEIDYCPSQRELDRHLFLEAILSAQEHLIITHDSSKDSPSSVVAELLPFVSKKQIITHPSKSHDSSYFDGLSPHLKNFSQFDYHLASRFHENDKVSPFFSPPVSPRAPEGDSVIEIFDLLTCLRSPLKHYLRHRFKTRVENEIENEEAFILSPLERAIARRESMHLTPQKAVEFIKKRGNFPIGPFEELAHSQLISEIDKVHSAFPSYLWQNVEFVRDQKKVELNDEGLWLLPSPKIELNARTTVHVVGSLEGATPFGLCVLDSASLKGIIKAWPLFLLLSYASALPPGWQTHTLFFARDGASKERFFHDPLPSLQAILEYYFLSQQMPSPLHPDWIESFLDPQGGKKLERLMKSPDHHDPFIQWAVRGNSHENCSELHREWGKIARLVYQEMSNAWF